MALDGAYLHIIKNELSTLIGGRVEKTENQVYLEGYGHWAKFTQDSKTVETDRGTVELENAVFRNEAKRNQLRYLVHQSDGISARLQNGYSEHLQNQEQLLHYLQNITQVDCKEIIFQTNDGWFLNLHSPHDGEIEAEWKSKIIGVKRYSTAELYGINDSGFGAIYVLNSGDKKALFVIHHYQGGLGGCYYSPDHDPFMYDSIKVYCDWKRWNDFGYAACETDNRWKLIKITQFPTPDYEVVGEAMRSIGVDNSAEYECRYV